MSPNLRASHERVKASERVEGMKIKNYVEMKLSWWQAGDGTRRSCAWDELQILSQEEVPQLGKFSALFEKFIKMDKAKSAHDCSRTLLHGDFVFPLNYFRSSCIRRRGKFYCFFARNIFRLARIHSRSIFNLLTKEKPEKLRCLALNKAVIIIRINNMSMLIIRETRKRFHGFSLSLQF